MIASFHFWGDFSCYPNIDKDVVKALRECREQEQLDR